MAKDTKAIRIPVTAEKHSRLKEAKQERDMTWLEVMEDALLGDDE